MSANERRRKGGQVNKKGSSFEKYEARDKYFEVYVGAAAPGASKALRSEAAALEAWSRFVGHHFLRRFGCGIVRKIDWAIYADVSCSISCFRGKGCARISGNGCLGVVAGAATNQLMPRSSEPHED